MPIYEYECSKCHSRFEKRQGFDAKPLATCPKCQGDARRVLHPAPVHFKGSGFYVTDSRNSGAASSTGKQESAQTEKGK